MNHVFIQILNNSLIASLLILAVMIVRLMIKRAPKWFSCVLWGLVAIKLVLPFSIESVFSLVPSSQPIPSDIEYSAIPHIDSGVEVINRVVNPVIEKNFTPQEVVSVNPLQIVIMVCSVVWIAGMIALLMYSFLSYLLLKKKVAASRKINGNVYVCDEVVTPFILGVLRPRIYLPTGVSDETMECILEHEKAHLKRMDYVWKPLGFGILAVYWFHPLCWVAYVLHCKDIELACDEKVTRDKDKEWKATYCQALLDCNTQRRIIAVCPIAFGEVSVKDRVKSVLNYKKPAFWIVAAAIVVSIIVVVCFMTNPKSLSDKNEDHEITTENSTSGKDTREIEYAAASVDVNTMPGADGAQIDCGNDNYIVFHDYYGLFVYNWAERKLQTSLNLASIGCEATQGDAACEVFPTDDFSVVIHAMNSDKMYEFDYINNKVTEQMYEATRTYSSKNLVILSDYVEQDPTIWKSYYSYLGEQDSERVLIWLETGSGLPIDLSIHIKYIDMDAEERVQIFGKQDNTANLAENLQIGTITSSRIKSDVTLGVLRWDMFLHFSGKTFQCDEYVEPKHGFASDEWCSLGGIGVCDDAELAEREVFENGVLKEYHDVDNHMTNEKIEEFSFGNYTGCLYTYELDLFTAAEEYEAMEKGKIEESDLRIMKHWVAFYTKGEGEPLYMQFFNCDYFTKEEVLVNIESSAVLN